MESWNPMPSPKSAEALPAVPPSSSEIAVRTMASDIEAMGKAGGFAQPSQIERVPVSPASIMPPIVGPTGEEVRPPKKTGMNMEPIIWTGIAILIAGILFALGYYLPALL